MRVSKNLVLPALTGLLFGALLFSGACQEPPEEPEAPADRADVETSTVEPAKTEGAPYPAAPPSDRVPNVDQEPIPVPTGPRVGDMQPANPELRVEKAGPKEPDDGEKPLEEEEEAGDLVARMAPLSFKDYAELINSQPASSYGWAEVSVAENAQTIMATGNVWMALSEDGGGSFSSVNPTTIFPEVDGRLFGDQVIYYVPQIDMFVWLLQYWFDDAGDNRIRIAAQTTSRVRGSNGTAWTYWDFRSDVFNSSGFLDYNDMSFGSSNLYWSSSISGDRVVVRIPLSEIAAKGPVHFSWASSSDTFWSHVSQNANDTVYWAGHLSNSEMRVYSMRDADGFYSWRSVTVNSWPNGTNTSTCPDGTDWLAFDSWKHYVFGNAVQGGNVWFGWLASGGEGFPQPHVQLVRINTSTWNREEQVQIWNPDFAFGYPYLSSNAEGEIGMSVGFGGGGNFHPSHAVGVWGDFVVYYPRLSTRCTQRWGDYNTSRRSASNSMDWVAGGYTMETDDSGDNIVLPHYIRFGRP